MHTRMCTHARTHTCMHARVRMCMRARMHPRMHARTQTHTHTRTQTHTHAYTRTHGHAHAHAHIRRRKTSTSWTKSCISHLGHLFPDCWEDSGLVDAVDGDLGTAIRYGLSPFQVSKVLAHLAHIDGAWCTGGTWVKVSYDVNDTAWQQSHQ